VCGGTYYQYILCGNNRTREIAGPSPGATRGPGRNDAVVAPFPENKDPRTLQSPVEQSKAGIQQPGTYQNYTPGTARFSRNFGKQRPYLLIVTAIHENDIFCRWKYPMVVFLSHCGFSSYGRSSNYSGGKLFLFSQIYQIMLTPIFSKFTIYPRQNTYSLPICFSTYLG